MRLSQKTRAPGAGRGAAQNRRRSPTGAPNRPVSLVRSAPSAAPSTGSGGAAVVMPHADTPAMQHHLDAIARTLAPTAHALLMLDQAGWHTTGKLRVPENLSLLPLPPKSPELNPVETVCNFFPEQTLQPHLRRLPGNRDRRLQSLKQPPCRSRPHHLNRNPPVGNYHSRLRPVGIRSTAS